MSTDPLHSLAAKVDIDRYNGALLAGLEGVVIKSHGSASERGFLHAILQGREACKGSFCVRALRRWQQPRSNAIESETKTATMGVL